MNKNNFGDCCEDLNKALTVPPHSSFIVNEMGILFLTVGYADTKNGPGWFDQALLFCPFCGKKIQDPQEILNKTKEFEG